MVSRYIAYFVYFEKPRVIVPLNILTRRRGCHFSFWIFYVQGMRKLFALRSHFVFFSGGDLSFSLHFPSSHGNAQIIMNLEIYPLTFWEVMVLKISVFDKFSFGYRNSPIILWPAKISPAFLYQAALVFSKNEYTGLSRLEWQPV